MEASFARLLLINRSGPLKSYQFTYQNRYCTQLISIVIEFSFDNFLVLIFTNRMFKTNYNWFFKACLSTDIVKCQIQVEN